MENGTVIDSQIAVVVGFLVSLVFQWLKRVWPRLDQAGAIEKQITVAILAGIGALASAGWHFSWPTAWRAVLAALAAYATHRGLLREQSVVYLSGNR